MLNGLSNRSDFGLQIPLAAAFKNNLEGPRTELRDGPGLAAAILPEREQRPLDERQRMW